MANELQAALLENASNVGNETILVDAGANNATDVLVNASGILDATSELASTILENVTDLFHNATAAMQNATSALENATCAMFDVPMPSSDIVWAAVLLALLLVVHHTVRLCTRRTMTLRAVIEEATPSKPGQDQ